MKLGSLRKRLKLGMLSLDFWMLDSRRLLGRQLIRSLAASWVTELLGLSALLEGGLGLVAILEEGLDHGLHGFSWMFVDPRRFQ